LGRAELVLGNLEAAAAWVGKSLEIAPDWPFARFVQGTILEKSGDRDGARREYRFTLEHGRFDLPARARAALERLKAWPEGR
jgi:Flp pilus assembly protein TadD